MFGRVPSAGGRLVEPRQQIDPVHRVDPRERAGRLAGLVRLQVSNQVPLQREIAQERGLVEALLHAVFTEMALTGAGGRAHEARVERLGDGDERNGGGIACRALGGRGDAAADVVEVGGNVRAGRHDYLIVARMALATSANSPVGASFRYSWNGAFASAIEPLPLLARLKMAIPR